MNHHPLVIVEHLTIVIICHHPLIETILLLMSQYFFNVFEIFQTIHRKQQRIASGYPEEVEFPPPRPVLTSAGSLGPSRADGPMAMNQSIEHISAINIW
jgi:hypothetical protein